jgi:hypothetical protein
VIDGDGIATLGLRASGIAGTFISTTRSGFQVQFEDSEPPRREAVSPPIPASSRLGILDLMTITAQENGPSMNGRVAWGDGKTEMVDFRAVSGSPFWPGDENTRFTTDVLGSRDG